MRRPDRFRSLTPLRAMVLLEETYSPHRIPEAKLESVRDALREHVKAALVKASKRRRRSP